MNNCEVNKGRIDLWADLKLGLKQAGQDNMSQASCKSQLFLSLSLSKEFSIKQEITASQSGTASRSFSIFKAP